MVAVMLAVVMSINCLQSQMLDLLQPLLLLVQLSCSTLGLPSLRLVQVLGSNNCLGPDTNSSSGQDYTIVHTLQGEHQQQVSAGLGGSEVVVVTRGAAVIADTLETNSRLQLTTGVGATNLEADTVPLTILVQVCDTVQPRSRLQHVTSQLCSHLLPVVLTDLIHAEVSVRLILANKNGSDSERSSGRVQLVKLHVDLHDALRPLQCQPVNLLNLQN